MNKLLEAILILWVLQISLAGCCYRTESTKSCFISKTLYFQPPCDSGVALQCLLSRTTNILYYFSKKPVPDSVFALDSTSQRRYMRANVSRIAARTDSAWQKILSIEVFDTSMAKLTSAFPHESTWNAQNACFKVRDSGDTWLKVIGDHDTIQSPFFIGGSTVYAPFHF